MDLINVVETRAQTSRKLATTPQTDLEVAETPDKDKVVDPTDLPNQDPWPFTQQQHRVVSICDKFCTFPYFPHINWKRIAQFLHFDPYFETTFNCLVSTVYNLVRVNDSMVLEIIKHLRELQFRGVKIISIDTEQVSGYPHMTLQKIVYNKPL
uniref:Uncharacterized protein n=1 Tax=Romanomermis culicivorax TaxID=13658 RepID=A0A915II84_ROMCU